MRILTIAIFAAALSAPAMGMAATRGPALSAPAATDFSAPASATAPAEGVVRMALAPTTIPAGESLPEHMTPTVRYVFVLSGRVRVSNLVTGEDQEVSPGQLAVETEGHWHVATALDGQPANILLIDGSDLAGMGLQP